MEELRSQTDQKLRATIKGVFVNTHAEAVYKVHGDDGVARLETLTGHQVRYRPNEDVPVEEEIRIIEAAVQLLVDRPVSPEELVYEGGRLHLRNFLMTPWAQTVSGIFSNDFRYLMLHVNTIGARIFEGIEFHAEDLGDGAVKIVLINSAYPAVHFQGGFQEWMELMGHTGTVMMNEPGPNICEYVLRWRND